MSWGVENRIILLLWQSPSYLSLFMFTFRYICVVWSYKSMSIIDLRTLISAGPEAVRVTMLRGAAEWHQFLEHTFVFQRAA